VKMAYFRGIQRIYEDGGANSLRQFHSKAFPVSACDSQELCRRNAAVSCRQTHILMTVQPRRGGRRLSRLTCCCRRSRLNR
jgi:hypothetical protein